MKNEGELHWRNQFLEWLKEICPGQNPELYVLFESDSNPPTETRVKLYTHDFVYSIVACERETRLPYLGCTVSNRTPRAGEDWTRGNDLPDGEFNEETWNRIKNAIIAYEVVRIAKKTRSEGDWVKHNTKYRRDKEGDLIYTEWEQKGDIIRNQKRFVMTPEEKK